MWIKKPFLDLLSRIWEIFSTIANVNIHKIYLCWINNVTNFFIFLKNLADPGLGVGVESFAVAFI